MSYTPTEYNPIILKNEGSTVASQKGSNAYTLIDPNPGMEGVPLEDLFIFVDLKARTRNRTLITATPDKTYNLTVLQGTVVSVGAGNQENSVSSEQLFNGLTTDWTQIGGIGSIKAIGAGEGYDPQGFAITNIDIAIKSQAAPMITIDFIDVRGATLFEQGSCSPYGFFFQLPYPIFELTVKGYYGKAVTYYLNLVKFNAKFNSDTGNFECKAEFVGYSFAFLSDILMGYIMAAPFLDQIAGGRYNFAMKLKKVYQDTIDFYKNNIESVGNIGAVEMNIDTFCPDGKCINIFTLIKSLKTFLDKASRGLLGAIANPNYEEAQSLTFLLDFYLRYRNLVEKAVKELGSTYTVEKTSLKSGSINGERPLKIVFGKDSLGSAIMTSQVASGGKLYEIFNRNGGTFLSAIKEVLKQADKYTKITGGGVPKATFTLQSSNPATVINPTVPSSGYPIFDVPELTNEPWFAGGTAGNTNSFSSLGYVSSDKTTNNYYIDFGYILENIDNDINIIRRTIDLTTDAASDISEAKIVKELKFSPTIRSVFTILLANTQAFMEILKEVSTKAEKYHLAEDLNKYTSDTNVGAKVESTDIQASQTSNKKVYSWPTYSVIEGSSIGTGEIEKYPGINPDFYEKGKPDKSWPELIFVEDFLNAFIKYQKAIEALFNPSPPPGAGTPTYDNYIPINPLESQYWVKDKPNGWSNRNTNRNTVLKTIGDRLFVALDHTIMNPMRITRDAMFSRRPINIAKFSESYASTAAKIDAFNLLNSTNNKSQLDSWITDSTATVFIQSVIDQLKNVSSFGNQADATFPYVTKAINLTKIYTDGYTLSSKNKLTSSGKVYDTEIDSDEEYYVFKPKDGFINFRLSVPIKIFPNPFKMDKGKYLLKIVKPADITTNNIRDIVLSNQTIKDFVNGEYTNSVKAFNLGFGNPIYKDAMGLDINNLVKIGGSQNSPDFNGEILYSTLGKYSPVDGAKTSSSMGSELSNAGFLSFWLYDKYDTNNNNVVGIDIIFRQKRNITTNPVTASYDLEDVKGKIFAKNHFYAPLIATPLWLDNVNNFRSLATGSLIYDEPTQFKNLAYLFLNSFKPTPLTVRLISGDGRMSQAYDSAGNKFPLSKYSQPDPNLPLNFKLKTYGGPESKLVVDTDRGSMPWASTAFQNIAAINEIPKFWVLAFGSQLWRWREFTGSAKGAKWRKTILCFNCDLNKPQVQINGYDPLVQPTFDLSSAPGSRKSYNPAGNRWNVKNYIDGVYGTYNAIDFTKTPKSVFSPQSYSDALKDGSRPSVSAQGGTAGGFTIENGISVGTPDLVGAFYYFGGTGRYNSNIPGTSSTYLGKLSPWTELLGYSFSDLIKKDQFSWPQAYIAPHHIPYISPDITGALALDSPVKNLSTGKGASFTLLMENSFLGGLDYQTIQPVRATTKIVGGGNRGYALSPYVDIDSADNTLFNKYPERSRQADGSLGMIMQYLPDAVKDIFVEEFEKFATSQEWKDMLKKIDPLNFGPNPPTIADNQLIGSGKYVYKKGSGSPAALTKINAEDRVVLVLDAGEVEPLFKEIWYVCNSTPKIWYGYQDESEMPKPDSDPFSSNSFIAEDPNEDGFIVRKSDFERYLTTFYDTYKANLQKRKDELTPPGGGGGGGGGGVDPAKDNDLKLAMYRTFKSLSEKWLQRTTGDGELFFNIGGASSVYCKKNGPVVDKKQRTLASYFVYVNRVWGDIGNQSVIDIRRLDEIKDNNRLSLYQIISDILSENEYLFFGLPTYINFTGNGLDVEDTKDIFRPVLNLDDAGCGPLFVCMYVGGASRKLNLQIGETNCKIDNDELKTVLNNVRDDSFSLEDIQQPNDIASGGFTAFKVLYGKQNQNHFRNIQLDQTEFTETAESLAVLDRLAESQGTTTTSKGQNLNSAYLTRSYSCSIETMGNMMIQPMMYFDLQGIPMFSGAYIITDVTHNIKPNSITTNFKGVRQPRTVVPIVTSVSVALGLTPPTGGGVGLTVSLGSLSASTGPKSCGANNNYSILTNTTNITTRAPQKPLSGFSPVVITPPKIPLFNQPAGSGPANCKGFASFSYGPTGCNNPGNLRGGYGAIMTLASFDPKAPGFYAVYDDIIWGVQAALQLQRSVINNKKGVADGFTGPRNTLMTFLMIYATPNTDCTNHYINSVGKNIQKVVPTFTWTTLQNINDKLVTDGQQPEWSPTAPYGERYQILRDAAIKDGSGNVNTRFIPGDINAGYGGNELFSYYRDFDVSSGNNPTATDFVRAITAAIFQKEFGGGFIANSFTGPQLYALWEGEYKGNPTTDLPSFNDNATDPTNQNYIIAWSLKNYSYGFGSVPQFNVWKNNFCSGNDAFKCGG